MKRIEMCKFYMARLYRNIFNFVKWVIVSSIVGLVVGSFSTLFAYLLRVVTEVRTQHPELILLLPVAGVVIVFLYGIFHYKNDKGTNMVLSTIHAQTELPFKMGTVDLYINDYHASVWRIGRSRRSGIAIRRKYR